MTYRPLVPDENYEVWLELVQYVDGYRHVHARRTDWAGFGPSPGQYCWVYRNTEPWEFYQRWRYPLLDSEACPLPLKLDPFLDWVR